MRDPPSKDTPTIRDIWLIQAGREFRLSEAFDRWERAGIALNRPFTVVVDTVGRRITVEQEAP